MNEPGDNLATLFELAPGSANDYVGQGLQYPWGGLYGGHIVAQALRAAAHSTADGLLPHSLRAYFIRRGNNAEPVRYEVDRIRDGRSFATRRVVASQHGEAILNLEASFHRTEDSPDIQTLSFPAAHAMPASIASDTWSSLFDRRYVPETLLPATATGGIGRVAAWMRATGDFGGDELLHRCALAYLSDDLPCEAVIRAWPDARRYLESTGTHPFNASLDHAVWFHRTVRADRWHLHDVSCHNFAGGRGLAIGHVFDEDGLHVATVAQEALVRLPP
ncbi:MAG TPA: acyl-CoA thioesterase domain-containing protein [Candidatus Binatia bacterium]|jgi:acyl-CoA thioesterase-2